MTASVNSVIFCSKSLVLLILLGWKLKKERFLFRLVLKTFQSVETALGFEGSTASLKLKFKNAGLWSEERSSMELIVKGALATELTSTLSSLLINRLRLGNGQPTNRHGTGTSRIATERYEDTFASAYTM
ncbi:hypothetical protein TNCV_1299751 [Trichonephila clavipes]|nr:hypothetical protein TNCV_1299751 [Trichonephila clavipes]